MIGERQAILDAVGRTLETHAPEVIAAYVFGSVGRGEHRDSSDVDVGVIRTRGMAGTGFSGLPLDLEGELERALGRTVQVVTLETAPPDLVHRVLRDGAIVVDRDRAARVRFEVRARNEYFDILPRLEEYRRPRRTR
jgi:predicted nucleotidyltransferase